VTLILLIVFLSVAITGRIALQYKLTGDFGVRPATLSSPWSVKLAGGLLFLSLASASILSTLNTFGFLFYPISSLAYFFGIAIASFGIALTVISQYQMGISWRIGVDEDEQTKLVTTGIYYYVRNPIYTGIVVFCVGLLTLMPGVYMLITVLVLMIGIEIQVRCVEEPYLIKKHGETFLSYVDRSGRYLPKFFSE